MALESEQQSYPQRDGGWNGGWNNFQSPAQLNPMFPAYQPYQPIPMYQTYQMYQQQPFPMYQQQNFFPQQQQQQESFYPEAGMSQQVSPGSSISVDGCVVSELIEAHKLRDGFQITMAGEAGKNADRLGVWISRISEITGNMATFEELVGNFINIHKILKFVDKLLVIASFIPKIGQLISKIRKLIIKKLVELMGKILKFLIKVRDAIAKVREKIERFSDMIGSVQDKLLNVESVAKTTGGVVEGLIQQLAAMPASCQKRTYSVNLDGMAKVVLPTVKIVNKVSY